LLRLSLLQSYEKTYPPKNETVINLEYGVLESRNQHSRMHSNLENWNLEESDAKPGPVVANLTLLGTFNLT